MMIKTAKNFLLDLIFPSLCLTCENYLTDNNEKICDPCLHSMPVYDYLLCPVCMNRCVGEGAVSHCHRHFPYLLLAATSYDNPVAKKIIWQFKYGSWQSLAGPLADLMAESLQKTGNYNCRDWMITPIPLHQSRLRKRGFNQSEALAERINKKMGLWWSKNNLVKIKNTGVQADLSDWKKREENIKDSFFVNHPEEFSGRNIILVDDVFTSGSTLAEAARVLKLAGAKKIIALTFARAR